jgi:hypothetical protein
MSQAPLYSLEAPNAKRGLQADLWRGSLQKYASNDPSYGIRLKKDFVGDFCFSGLANTAGNGTTGTTGVAYNSGLTIQDAVTAGGTYAVTPVSAPGGVALVANDGTTADFGVEVGGDCLCFTTPKATDADEKSERLIIEARVDLVAVNGQFVLGYTSAGVTTPVVGANDAVADHGYIVLQIDENGDLNLLTSSATGGTTDSVQVIATADWTKLDQHLIGLAVNRVGTSCTVEVCVDNQWYSPQVLGIDPASVPVGDLRPVIGATTSGTTAPSFNLDCLDCFAEFQGTN